jgi:hypothetical protein
MIRPLSVLSDKISKLSIFRNYRRPDRPMKTKLFGVAPLPADNGFSYKALKRAGTAELQRKFIAPTPLLRHARRGEV